jgi:hypothetical protein
MVLVPWQEWIKQNTIWWFNSWSHFHQQPSVEPTNSLPSPVLSSIRTLSIRKLSSIHLSSISFPQNIISPCTFQHSPFSINLSSIHHSRSTHLPCTLHSSPDTFNQSHIFKLTSCKPVPAYVHLQSYIYICVLMPRATLYTFLIHIYTRTVPYTNTAAATAGHY